MIQNPQQNCIGAFDEIHESGSSSLVKKIKGLWLVFGPLNVTDRAAISTVADPTVPTIQSLGAFSFLGTKYLCYTALVIPPMSYLIYNYYL